jgi:CPA2 family monovalent cation:H+ antiporter-2
MEHTGLLTEAAIALAVALVGGLAARRAGLPPLLGYLAAGLVLSPFTPGFDSDLDTLRELAELGVIFLMFGLGLHFDVRDLLSAGKYVAPAAAVLAGVIIALALAAGTLAGLSSGESFVIGLVAAISSSAVLSRTLQDRALVGSTAGNLAVAWAVVEDTATILILALLPLLAADGASLSDNLATLLKSAAFMALVVPAGRYAIPWVLRAVVRTGSRELFVVTVVVLAVGIAAIAVAFDVSVALGAFFAGVAISETEMGHQATADVLPLREAFAVLFFVSVGMLIDPESVIENLHVLTIVLVLVVAVRFLGITALFAALPFSGRTALLVGAALAQTGEFSFLIADKALHLGLIERDVYSTILAAAALAILANAALVRLVPRFERLLAVAGPAWRLINREGPVPHTTEPLSGHTVILGYGRVGALLGHALDQAGRPFLVVEANIDLARELEAAGVPVVWGDAASGVVLENAHLPRAALLVVTLPDENSTMLAVVNARVLAPGVPIVARARGQSEVVELHAAGVRSLVVPEYEGGLEVTRRVLDVLGVPEPEAFAIGEVLRNVHYTTGIVVDRGVRWRQ